MSVCVDRLSFAYGKEAVLREVSIEVSEGEVVALIGPNGSGKTTLLKCISGVLGDGSQQKRIRVAGERLDTLGARALARRLAALETEVAPFFDYTVREIVEMGRIPYSSRFRALREADYDIVQRSLERADVAKFADRPSSQLSSGESQRVWIAMALAQEPRVLLLDEPTSHLDLNYQSEVLTLVRELAAEGLSVLFSVHDLNLAALYADRVALLSGGRLIGQGAPDEILTEEHLQRAYGTEVQIIRDSSRRVVAVLPKRMQR